MRTGRLEAFSDGVLAIVITIMVLELKPPKDAENLTDLWPLWPTFVSYLLSYVYVGIYWNNHHHLLKATKRISGAAMWANMGLLFWLSLIPFVTAWMGVNRFAAAPTALYGIVMLLSAVSYFWLQTTLMADPANSLLARALGVDIKGKLSMLIYLVAIPLAYVVPWIAGGLYALVAVVWIVPDQRIEREVVHSEDSE